MRPAVFQICTLLHCSARQTAIMSGCRWIDDIRGETKAEGKSNHASTETGF